MRIMTEAEFRQWIRGQGYEVRQIAMQPDGVKKLADIARTMGVADVRFPAPPAPPAPVRDSWYFYQERLKAQRAGRIPVRVRGVKKLAGPTKNWDEYLLAEAYAVRKAPKRAAKRERREAALAELEAAVQAAAAQYNALITQAQEIGQQMRDFREWCDDPRHITYPVAGGRLVSQTWLIPARNAESVRLERLATNIAMQARVAREALDAAGAALAEARAAQAAKLERKARGKKQKRERETFQGLLNDIVQRAGAVKSALQIDLRTVPIPYEEPGDADFDCGDSECAFCHPENVE